eukprot:SAG11_NODE_12387_length_706_cov_0.678748_1_plen_52_part_10
MVFARDLLRCPKQTGERSGNMERKIEVQSEQLARLETTLARIEERVVSMLEA